MSVDEMHVVADHLIHFSDKFKKHNCKFRKLA